ncbi:hypothetical protein ACXWTF_12180 [Thiomicrolovo sp. ZZH C-3]
MKYLIILSLIAASLLAEIDVRQNIKALYLGVPLTKSQLDYILDNQSRVVALMKAQAVQTVGGQQIHDSNVVEFMLRSDGTADSYRVLDHASRRNIDRLSELIVMEGYKQMPVPPMDTPIRLIIRYRTGNMESAVDLTPEPEPKPTRKKRVR